eukprot:m.244738 g.244738  ORF g.244738 m.244738 type:complete len:343 (-) comp16106_c0_seq8:73-1101(-)
MDILSWVKHPGPNPMNPTVDTVLTFLLFGWMIGLCYLMYMRDIAELKEFAMYFIATSFAIPVIKSLSRRLGALLITKENAKKPRNLRKFGDQAWQLGIHITTTAIEYVIFLRHPVNLLVTHKGEGGVWEPVDQKANSDPLLNTLYMLQIAVWSYTALSHRFHEARHKDYFIMYLHHIVTIALVGISYTNGAMRVGLVVMFLHDSSDIVGDLLKMFNYLGLDEKSGLYITEMFFIGNLISWAYTRLYQFPLAVIYEMTFNDVMPHFRLQENPASMMSLSVCHVMLVVLLFMNAWWFFLFLRIGYRIIFSSEDPHAAGREEYEGDSSNSEDEENDVSQKKDKKM